MRMDTLAPTGLPAGTHQRALRDCDAVAHAAAFRAYCFSDGIIFYGYDTPQGAIEVVRGDQRQVRERLDVVCRHGWTPGVLLVPGVPEASDQREAADVLAKFLAWCKDCECDGLVWNTERKVAL